MLSNFEEEDNFLDLNKEEAEASLMVGVDVVSNEERIAAWQHQQQALLLVQVDKRKARKRKRILGDGLRNVSERRCCCLFMMLLDVESSPFFSLSSLTSNKNEDIAEGITTTNQSFCGCAAPILLCVRLTSYNI